MKFKLIVSIILAATAFVFGYQNIEVVQVSFLAWSVDVSLALLIFIALGSGLAIGWLLSSYLRFTRNRRRVKEEAGAQVENSVADKVSTTIAGDKKTDGQQG